VKYYYEKANFADMKQELSTIDWEEKLSIQDENKQWTFFVSINLDQHRCFVRISFTVFKSMLVLPFLSVAALDLRFGVYLS
jgi:hypothetical protein